MNVIIRVPTQLRQLTGGQKEIPTEASTVGEALERLTEIYPEIRDRLFDETGKVRRFVNIYLADEDIRYLDGVATGLEDGQIISLIPAVAGG